MPPTTMDARGACLVPADGDRAVAAWRGNRRQWMDFVDWRGGRRKVRYDHAEGQGGRLRVPVFSTGGATRATHVTAAPTPLTYHVHLTVTHPLERVLDPTA